MRIDRINLGVDTDEKGMVRSASVFFENINELGERISGNFGITTEQYKKIQAEELTIREIAEAKVVELFEIKPNQDALAGVVELRKDLEDKDKLMQELTEQLEMQTMLITELTLLISNLGMEEINEETNNEVPDPDTNENGGEGGE